MTIVASFDAYLALAAGGSGPGIALLQEIFGVNHVVRYHPDKAIDPGLPANRLMERADG